MQKPDIELTEFDQLMREGFFDRPKYTPCKEVPWVEGYVVDPAQSVEWNLREVKKHNKSILRHESAYEKACDQAYETFVVCLTQALLTVYTSMNKDQARLIAVNSYSDAKSRGNCGRELLEVSEYTAIEYLKLIIEYDSLRQ